MAETLNAVKQIMPGPQRSPKAEKAIELLADGRLRYDQVIEQIGIGRTTFYRWRSDPAFMARVRARREEIASAIYDRGAAIRHRRVETYCELWDGLVRVLEERAKDPTVQKIPGGKTGHVLMTFKGVGQGQAARVIPVAHVDLGIVDRIQELGKQIAQELGQWTEKAELSGPGGGPIQAEVGGRINMVEVHKVTRDDAASTAPAESL